VKLIHGESLRFDCVKRFNHTGKAFPFSIQVSEFTQNILRSLTWRKTNQNMYMVRHNFHLFDYDIIVLGNRR
ncbi:MAG: hypothetical protein SOV98_02355, partial [Limosilactobacillus sp.]|uniref:hypothetical protein n=1 Tax=Limosilactobacillus sp. TaxID=2773925 RepID=UPI002A75D203